MIKFHRFQFVWSKQTHKDELNTTTAAISVTDEPSRSSSSRRLHPLQPCALICPDYASRPPAATRTVMEDESPSKTGRCVWTRWAHLPKHHDDAVAVQEAGRIPLIQSHLCFHRSPASSAELLFLRLRAGGLQQKANLSVRFLQEEQEVSAELHESIVRSSGIGLCEQLGDASTC